MAERREVAALLREGWRAVREMNLDETLEHTACDEERLTSESTKDAEKNETMDETICKPRSMAPVCSISPWRTTPRAARVRPTRLMWIAID
jgi:hypothetical protein